MTALAKLDEVRPLVATLQAERDAFQAQLEGAQNRLRIATENGCVATTDALNAIRDLFGLPTGTKPEDVAAKVAEVLPKLQAERAKFERYWIDAASNGQQLYEERAEIHRKEVEQLQEDIERLNKELARYRRADVPERVKQLDEIHARWTKALTNSRGLIRVETHERCGELLDICRQQAAEIWRRRLLQQQAEDKAQILIIERDDLEAQRDSLRAVVQNAMTTLGLDSAAGIGTAIVSLQEQMRAFEEADTKPQPLIERVVWHCAFCSLPMGSCKCGDRVPEQDPTAASERGGDEKEVMPTGPEHDARPARRDDAVSEGAPVAPPPVGTAGGEQEQELDSAYHCDRCGLGSPARKVYQVGKRSVLCSECRKAMQEVSEPSKEVGEFRAGLPPKALREVCHEWEDLKGDVVWFNQDGIHYDWLFLAGREMLLDPTWDRIGNSPILGDSRWRPWRKTWQEVELAAARRLGEEDAKAGRERMSLERLWTAMGAPDHDGKVAHSAYSEAHAAALGSRGGG